MHFLMRGNGTGLVLFSELIVCAYLEIGGGKKGKIDQKSVYASKWFIRVKKLQYLSWIFFFFAFRQQTSNQSSPVVPDFLDKQTKKVLLSLYSKTTSHYNFKFLSPQFCNVFVAAWHSHLNMKPLVMFWSLWDKSLLAKNFSSVERQGGTVNKRIKRLEICCWE